MNVVSFRSQKKESEDAKSLELDHLEGIFFVLTYGIILAFLYGVFDTIRVICRRARKFKVKKRCEKMAKITINNQYTDCSANFTTLIVFFSM